MKKLTILERLLVILIGGGILAGMYIVPFLLISKISNWFIAILFLIAFKSWIKEVTTCK